MADADKPPSRGEVAFWVLGSLLRDMKRELDTNGKQPPSFAQDVLKPLYAMAEIPVPDDRTASGTDIARVVTTSWISVHEAAAQTGLSESYVRRLARLRAIRAQRLGRDWQIDPDSLINVPRRAA